MPNRVTKEQLFNRDVLVSTNDKQFIDAEQGLAVKVYNDVPEAVVFATAAMHPTQNVITGLSPALASTAGDGQYTSRL